MDISHHILCLPHRAWLFIGLQQKVVEAKSGIFSFLWLHGAGRWHLHLSDFRLQAVAQQHLFHLHIRQLSGSFVAEPFHESHELNGSQQFRHSDCFLCFALKQDRSSSRLPAFEGSLGVCEANLTDLMAGGSRALPSLAPQIKRCSIAVLAFVKVEAIFRPSTVKRP